MKNKKVVMGVGVALGLVLILLSFTSAFAISSEYWEEKAVELSPGQTKEIPIFLQNLGGDEDINVQAIMTQPAGVARFLGQSDTYSVPVGTKVQVNVSFTAPENAAVGKTYSVTFAFKVIDNSETKSLGIGSSIERTIPVLIVPKPIVGGEGVAPWVYLITVLVILAIAFVLWKVLSKESKKK